MQTLTTSTTPCETCRKNLVPSVLEPTALVCLNTECPTFGFIRMFS